MLSLWTGRGWMGSDAHDSQDLRSYVGGLIILCWRGLYASAPGPLLPVSTSCGKPPGIRAVVRQTVNTPPRLQLQVRVVKLVRKMAGPDSGEEAAARSCSLVGTCRLDGGRK